MLSLHREGLGAGCLSAGWLRQAGTQFGVRWGLMLSKRSTFTCTGARVQGRNARCLAAYGSSRRAQRPNSGVSYSLPGLVFFGMTRRLLCQNIPPIVTSTLKSLLDSRSVLVAKAVPAKFI